MVLPLRSFAEQLVNSTVALQLMPYSEFAVNALPVIVASESLRYKPLVWPEA